MTESRDSTPGGNANLPRTTTDLDQVTSADRPRMTSRQIADLLSVRHDSVRRAIERLAEKAVIAHPPTVDVQEIGGNSRTYTTTEYVFSGEQGKRDSYVVVAQLSPEFTARLVDRWQELEARPAAPSPATLSRMDLIRLAYEAEKELEATREQVAALEHKVEEVAPKAEFYDRFASADGLYGIQNAGRVLGRKPNKFSQWLKQKHLFYQGGSLVPRAEYRGMGIFEVKSEMVDDKARYRTWITPKGLQYFAKRAEAAGVPAA